MNRVVTRSSLGQTLLRWRGKKQSTNQPQTFLKKTKRESNSLQCLCAILFTCEWFSSMRNSGRGGAESWNWGGKTPAPVKAGTIVKQPGKKRPGGLGSAPSWTWATNLCSWQGQQTGQYPGLQEAVSAAGWGRGSRILPLHSHSQQQCQALLRWDGLEGASCAHERLCSRGLALLDGAEKEAKRHKRGRILQVWNGKALLKAKRLKIPPSTQKKKQPVLV